MSSLKISGPPGTGKTTELIRRITEVIKQGRQPEEILYVVFNKAAAADAIQRVSAATNLPTDRFPFFKTLHAYCYGELSPKPRILAGFDYIQMAKSLGLYFTPNQTENEGSSFKAGMSKGDFILNLINLARSRLVPVADVYADLGVDVPFNTPLAEVNMVKEFFEKYKLETGKMDFVDLLERFSADSFDTGSPPVCFFDEAQDFSPLMWKCLGKIRETTESVVIAGDDDQAIHEWAGASAKHFIDYRTDESLVLGQSYRIPASVHYCANEIVHRIKYRLPKEYKPRPEAGEVLKIGNLNSIRVLDYQNESWLFLYRNNKQAESIREFLLTQGVRFQDEINKDIDKYIDRIKIWQRLQNGEAIHPAEASFMYEIMSQRDRVKRGFKKILSESKDSTPLTYEKLVESFGLVALKTAPWYSALDMIPDKTREYLRQLDKKKVLHTEVKIRLSTIHSAKGSEADNVVLLTDISERTENGLFSNPDQEHRVWYVGVTRAKKRLFIILPATQQFYRI